MTRLILLKAKKSQIHQRVRLDFYLDMSDWLRRTGCLVEMVLLCSSLHGTPLPAGSTARRTPINSHKALLIRHGFTEQRDKLLTKNIK